jgi:acyl carrier protein
MAGGAGGVSETVFAGVVAALAEIAGIDPAKLTEDVELFRDLGLDSASALELLVTLEDKFAIHIRTDDARELRTVQDLVRLVDAALE